MIKMKNTWELIVILKLGGGGGSRGPLEEEDLEC